MKKFIASAAVLSLIACSEPKSPDQKLQPNAPAAKADIVQPPAVPVAPAAPVSRWTYSDQNDEMRGTTTHFANLESDNYVGVVSPYSPAPARMAIRKRSTDGLAVMIMIDGQFVCNDYSGDTVAVKFDDGEITNFRCSEPDGGSPGVLFINSENRFLAALKKADKVILELPVYDVGPQQVTFTVKGLVWE